MSWTEAELEALLRAYAAGALRVTFDGRTVEYGTAPDLLSRIRWIEAQMAAARGRPRVRVSLATFSKG